jgi:hypothetical protein
VRVLLGFALLAASCRPLAPPPAIDPRLASRIPEDASAIAGFNPAAFRNLTTAFAEERYVLIALEGTEVLTITAGSMPPAPARHRVSPLLAEAERLAEHSPAWAVIRGGTVLPLPGNLVNLNQFLRNATLVRLSAQGGNPPRVELTATCPNLQSATQFENSLRAVLVLTKLGSPAELRRDGQTVHASLTPAPEALTKLLH